MKKGWIIFFLVAMVSVVKAQGIAGRRISAEAEFDYFMRYYAPLEHSFTLGGKVKVGYVIAPRLQVYVGVNYYKLNLLRAVRDTVSSGTLGDATDFVTCMELDLTGRYFLRGLGERNYNCIAPDGKYFEFGVMTTKTAYTPGELSYYSYYGSEPLRSQITSTRLSFGFGNQQVWWDRLIVNTGILVSFPVFKWGDYDQNNAPYKQWQMGHNMLRAYVGFGVLL